MLLNVRDKNGGYNCCELDEDVDKDDFWCGYGEN